MQGWTTTLEAESEDRASSTGFRNTDLQILDSELLVSRTMKKLISVYLSHPVYSTFSSKHGISHYYRYPPPTHTQKTQVKLRPSPNLGEGPCELQGNDGPLFTDPFVISASLLARQ